ncbi:hypothetical protein INT48_002811 [Thamnidium elegans]|uniref:Uncharacterized protein n=1 Tax=Thamnidium elegans TaxID=101142 RepID=A0A8H7SL46_9FUNG|nr:hypothetical protein INT48_002811 [Thamnidium elegans]
MGYCRYSETYGFEDVSVAILPDLPTNIKQHAFGDRDRSRSSSTAPKVSNTPTVPNTNMPNSSTITIATSTSVSSTPDTAAVTKRPTTLKAPKFKIPIYSQKEV